LHQAVSRGADFFEIDFDLGSGARQRKKSIDDFSREKPAPPLFSDPGVLGSQRFAQLNEGGELSLIDRDLIVLFLV
jgi:hypothetical protein